LRPSQLKALVVSAAVERSQVLTNLQSLSFKYGRCYSS
jgi:hypothetical protein